MSLRGWVSALLICGAAAAQNPIRPAAELWKRHMESGRALATTGHYSDAKEEFEAALQVAGKGEMNFASRIELGTLAASIGRYTEAEQWDNQAVRLGVELYGKEGLELALPYANLAALYREQREYARAEELGRRALGLVSGNLSALPAVTAQVLGTLGGILYYRGKLPEAETILRQSIQIASDLPQSSEILAGDLSNLANVYARTGRNVEALGTFQKAYVLVSSSIAPADPSLFYILAGMASVQAGDGRYTEAVASLEAAIRVADAGSSINSMPIRDALIAEAAWLHKLKREGEAKRVRARASRVARAAAQNSYSQYTLDAGQLAKSIH